MVDNLDVASERDLAALTELSAHLEQMRRPVFLIAAGGELAATRLMSASGGLSRIATGVTGRFDVREVGAMTDDDLRPALTEPLRQAGIATNPRRWTGSSGRPTAIRPGYATGRDCAPDGAAEWRGDGRRGEGRDGPGERQVEGAVPGRLEQLLRHEKDLLAKVAAHGPHGLALPADTGIAALGRWQEFDATGSTWLPEACFARVATGSRSPTPDCRNGSRPGSASPPPTSASRHRPAPQAQAAVTESARPATTREYKGMTFHLNS